MRLQQNGFSVTELLVAVGLMAAVTLGLSSVMNVASKSNAAASKKLNEANLVNSTMVSLFTRKSCDASFKGRTLDSAGSLNVTEVKDANGGDVIKKGMSLEQKTHTVKSLRLQANEESWKEFKNHTFASPDESLQLSTALEVVFEREKGSESGVQKISFSVGVDKDGNITQCMGGDNSANVAALKSACISFGGTFDEVTGQCKATQDCGTVAGDAPISQKCVADKMKALKNALKSKSSTGGGGYGMITSIKQCMASSYVQKSRSATGFSCVSGSFNAKAENGTFTFSFGSTTYSVTDPAQYKMVVDTVAAFPQ
ncbi:type II secretion system protein J [Bdellovibrio sp. HCB274]|uniref:PulJ/GspJ family protein n=1 Tax=Bdellovibrio sp. HCB274 TaxID=3394361 RepID=UPI0039B5F95C